MGKISKERSLEKELFNEPMVHTKPDSLINSVKEDKRNPRNYKKYDSGLLMLHILINTVI